MEKQISSGLKITFLVHFIVALFFGLVYLFIPEAWGKLIGWPVQDVTPWRLIGAAILGFSASSWLAYRATRWDQVRIIVMMEIVWPVLGALVTLVGLLSLGLPAIVWVNFIILAGFAAAFIYFYMKKG